MSSKNIFLVTAITTIFANAPTTTQESQGNRNAESERIIQEQLRQGLTHEERLSRRQQGLPSDPTKTPTSADVIDRHRALERKGIYYGKDRSGRPAYKRIWVHAKTNPEFGNVRLVIFHKASFWNPWSKDSFEVVGKYSDDAARNKLRRSISFPFFGKGGIWDPQLNTLFGGTQDKNIGARFTEYMNNLNKHQS